MKREPLRIRDARPEDAADLIDLWSRAGRSTHELPSSLEEATQAIVRLLTTAEERLVVGELAGVVVAAIALRRAPVSPIHTEQIVHTSFLLVRPEHRRHGYAQALLAEAVAWAEEKDIPQVSAVASSGVRETNRYFARLGLGTVATLRVAPTARLRTKLAPSIPAARASRVLAQRRSMRRRMGHGAA